jgi:PmbA/TldA metallopeptidase C-terminal domain
VISLEHFQLLADGVLSRLASNVCGYGRAYCSLAWFAETSQFVRFNQGLVGQAGQVSGQRLRIRVAIPLSSTGYAQGSTSFELSGTDLAEHIEIASLELEALCRQVALLPEDPFFLVNTQTVPLAHRVRSYPQGGVDAFELVNILRTSWHATGVAPQSADLVGIAASGPLQQGLASAFVGEQPVVLWHEQEGAWCDFSFHLLGMPEGYGRAVKRSLGFSPNQTRAQITSAFEQALASLATELAVLSKPLQTLAPGKYRAYLEPLAVAQLLSMFSWGACSAGALKRETNPLRLFWQGGQTFSEHFSLANDIDQAAQTHFQADGFIAPATTVLVDRGGPGQMLVSPRTAAEYGLVSNGASGGESPRALSMSAGTLDAQNALAALGTGLLISNLWYLNWSDQETARVTGMTRDAAFWVEQGKIVAPLVNARFDDTLLRVFGAGLVQAGAQIARIPETTSYDARDTSATFCPALLVDGFTITL